MRGVIRKWVIVQDCAKTKFIAGQIGILAYMQIMKTINWHFYNSAL